MCVTNAFVIHAWIVHTLHKHIHTHITHTYRIQCYGDTTLGDDDKVIVVHIEKDELQDNWTLKNGANVLCYIVRVDGRHTNIIRMIVYVSRRRWWSFILPSFALHIIIIYKSRCFSAFECKIIKVEYKYILNRCYDHVTVTDAEHKNGDVTP